MTTFLIVLGTIADDVIAARDELNQLDGVAGDGDLGITMTTAATALKTILPDLEGQDLAAILRRCGSELARRAPSSGGTLVATGFLRAARAAADASEGPTARLASAIEAAAAGIGERGKASAGDKTMLDALAPAARALRAAADEDTDVPAALERAASAAADGAEATKRMHAKIGRAGWLAERSEGHEDAGAHLVALAFASAARHARA